MSNKVDTPSFIHRLVSNKQPKTNQLLSLFLITVISLMSLAMLVVMTSGLENDLKNNYLKSNKQSAINLTKQIDAYLKVRRIQLQSQSKFPIMTQTLMQPETNQGVIKDFFNDIYVIGQHYQQALIDINGDYIYRRNESELPSPSEVINDYQALYNGDKDYMISITQNANNNHLFWLFAIPVHYGQSVEGIIFTKIPLNEIETELDLNQLINIRIKLISQDSVPAKSYEWGLAPLSHWHNIESNESTLNFQYSIDLSELNTSFDLAKNRLILSAVIIAILSTFFAIGLGRWFFVKPIERLQEFAIALSEGKAPELGTHRRMTVEIQALSNQIIKMGKKLHKREHALIDANEALHKNQNALIQSEKMAGLGQISAGIAHEINNPIGFIMSNLCTLKEYQFFLNKLVNELLALQQALTPEHRDYYAKLINQINETLKVEDIQYILNDTDCIIDESHEGALRVKEIVAGLKGYAHLGDTLAPVDINESIEATLKMVWNEIKYSCTLEKDLQPLPKFTCSGGHISQVLMNLFVNASHAMLGKQGEMKVRTYFDGKAINIEVEDNGSGIDSKHMSHIFEPFFTTKPVGEGTGLGMSICYDIIKEYGGNIHVESTLGEGTIFFIRLPV